jgi:hypothetical protein
MLALISDSPGWDVGVDEVAFMTVWTGDPGVMWVGSVMLANLVEGPAGNAGWLAPLPEPAGSEPPRATSTGTLTMPQWGVFEAWVK